MERFHQRYIYDPLKNLPTTWGLRPKANNGIRGGGTSEKPPHHMGIKTFPLLLPAPTTCSLKNLPTTWGLRPLHAIGLINISLL